MEHRLDNVFFRVERNGKWVNRCFSDLTKQEQEEFLEKYDDIAIDRLYNILQDSVLSIFSMLNLKERKEVLMLIAELLVNIGIKFDIRGY